MHALGCISSDVSWVHWVFWVFSNITHPSSGNPAGSDQSQLAFQQLLTTGASLFSWTHLVALSAPSVIDLMALFLAKLTFRSLVRTLHNDLPAKPRRPTFIGSQRTVQPWSCTAPSAPGTWHTYALVPRQCAPPRARKFPLTTCSVKLEKMSMIGRRVVEVISAAAGLGLLAAASLLLQQGQRLWSSPVGWLFLQP